MKPDNSPQQNDVSMDSEYQQNDSVDEIYLYIKIMNVYCDQGFTQKWNKMLNLFSWETFNGRNIEYVNFLPELYQKHLEVAPGLYRVQEFISMHRSVAPEDALSPANIKLSVDVSPTPLIGLQQ